nr:RNA-binding protein [Burkholderia ambifaria]
MNSIRSSNTEKREPRENAGPAAHRRSMDSRDFHFDFPMSSLTPDDQNRLTSVSSTNPGETMRMLVDNLNPDTTRNELQGFLHKYTGETFTHILFIGQASSRPGALIDVEGANRGALGEIRKRLNGMYWKRRRIRIWIFSFWDYSDAAEARRQQESRNEPSRETPAITLHR